MNLFKVLGKKRDSGGELCGRILNVESFQVRVESLVGEGGFASIYRVVDLGRKSTLALKHFRPGCVACRVWVNASPALQARRGPKPLPSPRLSRGDPDAVQSIYKEIGLMAELAACPHVLSLVAAEFTAGEEEANVLLEYCQTNLANFLHGRQGQALALGEALDIFEPVCLAVQAMHSLVPATAHR